MHLIIYGPEGSGKGTQAAKLSEKFSLPVYTSGDLVRETACKDDGHLGKVCKEALSKGIYVNDEDMFRLWRNRLVSVESKKGFILDGFPRNSVQASFLLQEVEKSGYKIDKIIYLTLTDEEAIERLALRKRKLFVGSTISHDSPERVKKRLAIYHAMEKDIVDFFKKKDMIITINAGQSRDEVFSDILKNLKSIQ